MKKNLINTVLVLACALSLAIICLFIWVILPEGKVNLEGLSAPGYFLRLYVKADWQNKGMRHIQALLKINPALSHLLPQEMLLLATFGSNGNEIRYLLLMQNSRLAKLLRIFAPWARERIKRPYAVFKGIIIVSEGSDLLQRELRLIKGACDSKENLPPSGDIYRGSQFLLKARLSVDNNRAQLSDLVKYFRDKYYFDLLKSSYSLQALEGNIEINDLHRALVGIRFNLHPGAEIAGVSDDARFLKQLVQRFCKADNIVFKYSSSIGDGHIDLVFEFLGIEEVLQKWLIKKKEQL